MMTVLGLLTNPSIATLNMGQLTFGMYYLGSYQGYATVSSFSLVPGVNVINATGAIIPDPTLNPAAYVSTGTFFSNYLAGQTSQLGVTMQLTVGVPVGVTGTVPNWLSTACNQLQSQGQVVAPQNLQLVSNVGLPAGSALSVNLANANSPTIGGVVQLTFTNPFDFGLEVQIIFFWTLLNMK